MSLLSVRIVALIVLFLATYLVGIVPVAAFQVWKKRRNAKRVLHVSAERTKSGVLSHVFVQLLMQFGGGVLFCVVFAHLIPEVRENFQDYLKTNGTLFRKQGHGHGHDHDHDHDHHFDYLHATQNHSHSNNTRHEDHDHNHEDHDHNHDHGHHHEHSIPYVELIICIGFFTVYFVEVVMQACLARFGHAGHHHHHQLHDSHLTSTNLNADRKSGSVDLSIVANNKKKLSTGYINYGIDIGFDEPNNKSIASAGGDVVGVTTSSVGHADANDRVNINDRVMIKPALIGDDHSTAKYLRPSANDIEEPVWLRFARGFVIVAAFSVHSIFDGLAIGLQSTPKQIWAMFFAISTHKLVIAFVLSVELYEQSKRLLVVAINMAIFSAMSPVGILIVIITEESIKDSSASNPVIIILNALAIGTILYIVFFEVLQKSHCNSTTGLIQFASMVFGFGIMLIINLMMI